MIIKRLEKGEPQYRIRATGMRPRVSRRIAMQ